VGSGKSSAFELLRRRLGGKPVKLIHYDASRYGGESLRRNFISHSATTLGFDDCDDNRRFHDGMYEGRKSAAVRMPESLSDWRKVGAPLWTLAVTLVVLLLLVAVVGFGVSYLTDKSPLSQIAAFIVGLAVPVGVMALLVAAAKAVLDGATVTTEESQPSADEQFRRRFDELVAASRKRHRVDRLVFFIDELDRCAPEDVVKTLISIKTFLDHADCVFVVAADRDVLEQALTTHLKQATPPNEDNPYYSSASSFLDKVFHHQMFLPPLRKMKLTHFARELVMDRDGIWRELREEGGQRYLDRVIYALVPSHVVSPRRVKVLLNNFATNTRIIQSRGLALSDRAPEIAKLTVLQTEFPSLSADLPQEPRLPELLLDPPPDPSPRLKRLLDRHLVTLNHDGDPVSAGASGDSEFDLLPETDPLLAPHDAADSRQRIAAIQNRDLYRYLKRTSGVGITGPARDLLYLEGAGRDHGLDDLSLSELVERDSLEAPETVLREVTDRPLEDKLAVVGLLCDISEGEFGEERANAITTLMGVVEQLGGDIAPRATRVVDALRAFESEQQLDERHLLGALRLGLSLDTAEGRALVDEVSSDKRLYDEPQLVQRTVALIDEMPDDLVMRLADAIATHTADDESVLTEALSPLTPEAAARFFAIDAVKASAVSRFKALTELDVAAAEAFAHQLYDIADRHGHEGRRLQELVQWALLNTPAAYPVVRGHADAVMSAMPAGEVRDSHALTGLKTGPPSDWGLWHKYLTGAPSELPWRPATVTRIASEVISHALEADALATAASLAPHVARLGEGQVGKFVESLTAATERRAWWNESELVAEQRQLYDVALALAPDRQTVAGEAVRGALTGDLSRISQPQPSRPSYAATVAPLASVEGLSAARELGVLLGADAAELIEDVLSAVPSGDSKFDAEAARTALALGEAASRDGGVVELGDTQTLLAALPDGWRAADAAAAWLRLDPSEGVVRSLATIVGDTRDQSVRDTLSAWAAARSSHERSRLIERLLDEQRIPTSWIAEIARHGTNDEQLVDAVTERIAAASRHERRGAYIDALLALAPDGRRAHIKVAKLMLALLDRNTKVDFELALRAAGVLGTDHQHGEKLRQAFDRATQDTNFAIPAKNLSELQRAGIRPKQRSLTESARDVWASLWGPRRR
jgi:hypothetical protein